MFAPMIHLGEIIIILIVVGLPVLCLTAIILAAMSRRGGSKQRRRMNEEETRLIQELNKGLDRLENRIEAIETILVERERNKEERIS